MSDPLEDESGSSKNKHEISITSPVSQKNRSKSPPSDRKKNSKKDNKTQASNTKNKQLDPVIGVSNDQNSNDPTKRSSKTTAQLSLAPQEDLIVPVVPEKSLEVVDLTPQEWEALERKIGERDRSTATASTDISFANALGSPNRRGAASRDSNMSEKIDSTRFLYTKFCCVLMLLYEECQQTKYQRYCFCHHFALIFHLICTKEAEIVFFVKKIAAKMNVGNNFKLVCD
ncbi:hypothetical protein RFI_27987 [Reticulomyxa filosa]|uniref:Uncharacterized protein n=1 Tax=Reticulomyxa filosa TaxID=46433 RepID=X6M712_RETFI|nr:hypothetical protein RFI_27987 [Reticulomyxa filosa]|eukprot:ETO09391.1 hypothetical protein RFI_27987 [Reticulomyxa filosa]